MYSGSLNGKVIPLRKGYCFPIEKFFCPPNDFGAHSNFLYFRFSLLSAYFRDYSRHKAMFH